MNLTRAEYAWTAGVFDVGGRIAIDPTGNGPWRRPIVSVDNPDSSIAEELLHLHGGTVLRKSKPSADSWSWRLYGANQIRAFLVPMRPYMRCAVKAERARLLIEVYPRVTKRGNTYTVRDRIAKQAFEDAFMRLGDGRRSPEAALMLKNAASI